jgi:hypothetical protein
MHAKKGQGERETVERESKKKPEERRKRSEGDRKRVRVVVYGRRINRREMV